MLTAKSDQKKRGLADQEQVPQAPVNPVANIILPAAPVPLVHAPPADNVPANVDNLEVNGFVPLA